MAICTMAKTSNTGKLRQPDAEHYRAAAEATLQQLGWCVAYLERIRKPKLAAALERNRSEIRRRGGL